MVLDWLVPAVWLDLSFSALAKWIYYGHLCSVTILLYLGSAEFLLVSKTLVGEKNMTNDEERGGEGRETILSKNMGTHNI